MSLEQGLNRPLTGGHALSPRSPCRAPASSCIPSPAYTVLGPASSSTVETGRSQPLGHSAPNHIVLWPKPRKEFLVWESWQHVILGGSWYVRCLRDKHAIEWAILNLRTSGVHTAVRKFTKCFCRAGIQPDLYNNPYEGGKASGIVLDLQGRSPGLRETRPTCLKPNSY